MTITLVVWPSAPVLLLAALLLFATVHGVIVTRTTGTTVEFERAASRISIFFMLACGALLQYVWQRVIT